MPKRTPEEEKARFESLLLRERELRNDGYLHIAGVDEAGRGPLAGAVYAAAVILPDDIFIAGLDDSKKLSEKKREQLFDEICEKAISYSIAFATESEIDEINILNATHLAMNRAVDGLIVPADYCIIDGNSIKNMSTPHETMVKGDAKSASIAAASILAKVTRDRYITELAKEYPEYGFDKHKGYGTKAHTEAILKYGVLPIHRKSFLTKLIK
ncbi:MAG: ribonuclease HII [Eubacteriales bacterium]|nr:ribonuclease HII [Eubacteriales bacterium]